MNTKVSDVENKISNVTDLVRQTDYNGKIKGIEKKYFTTADYDKFTIQTLDAKIKQQEQQQQQQQQQQ